MLKRIRDSKITHLTKNKHVLLIGLGVSVLSNLLLSLTTYHLMGSERIVLLPPAITEPSWIQPSGVSASYLKDMSHYLLLSTLNVTPQTVSSRKDPFLRYVHPSGYGEIKSQMLEEEAIIKKKNITKMFTPTNFEIDERAMKVKVSGELTTWVSKEKISQDKATFNLSFKMNAGKLQLVEFTEEKNEKAAH